MTSTFYLTTLAQVVTARLGLDDQTPRSFDAISQDTGTSPDTVRNHFLQAMYYLETDHPHLTNTKHASLDDIRAALARLNTSSTPRAEPAQPSAPEPQHQPRPPVLGRDIG